MPNPLHASQPDLSATVSASAGTGKTWLLVTRLIRLLLAGARADGILAVTFTRKAATEMQTRLNERLLELARCGPDELRDLLQQIDAPTDPQTLQRATTLYEDLLRAPRSVRATTFHAFCQDILRRFPLEAGIPPGFELLESTAELQQAAWDALCASASTAPESDVARAIEHLFEACNGLASTQSALNNFLAHRSDWWAYTEAKSAPLDYACDRLSAQLAVSATDQPEADFFDADMAEALAEFAALLRKHPGKKNAEALTALGIARDDSVDIETRFDQCKKAFLTAAGKPLARKEAKTQAKSMGDEGQLRFLALHGQICVRLEQAMGRRHAIQTLLRTRAWYQAGTALLAHYQQLKAEQRLLDFSDLEWQAYRLLNHSDNVHWVQYKLDQRIDHLLIDEFQDTNPTQWRLILPLLEELAANEDQRGRSVFLVGDNKQSIYRFRRADPELFVAAQGWLRQHLQAVTQPLDVSWRSAEAIMTLVNRVFASGPLQQRLTAFATHTTHHPALWGHVEFLPLIETDEENEENEEVEDTAPTLVPGLRNPLQAPRLLAQDQRYLRQGQQIAARIRRLIDGHCLIGPAAAARPLHYGDIIILLRHRTHAGEIEQALRKADIPYIGANRGTLLHSLEVQDLVALLNLLITPFNNLALASVLRSPLFSCSEQDLIALASLTEGHWMARLAVIGPQQPPVSPLHRAHRLLAGWQGLVGTLPVHDLLDRIYCDGDVLNRYHAAYPEHLQHRVMANLTRLIELALEIDSGRYPSVGRFVSRLHSLQQQAQDAPDEGLPLQTGARVRIMTIHAAKGLEAPVVFLADATNTGRSIQAHRAIVDWPADAANPGSFLLAGTKEQRDPFTAAILERHQQAEAREDANLLYVAITRPKQHLYISGCRPTRGTELGWYGLMATQCREAEAAVQDATATAGITPDESAPIVIRSGEPPSVDTITDRKTTGPGGAPSLVAVLAQPLEIGPASRVIAPSHAASAGGSPPGRPGAAADDGTRGIAIHRMLELLCAQQPPATIPTRVAAELAIAAHQHDIAQWFDEARRIFQDPDLGWIFSPQQPQTAYNEVAVSYRQPQTGHTVFGIIDRLIETDDQVWVIDYKTHAVTTPQQCNSLVDQYREQLRLYCSGAQQLFPQKEIGGGLLFTATGTFFDVSP
ncbi:MAG: UvrD-helicase domain-containing protein [Gammaproteobacteria bacterium]|nr:UvrD-helicase domain-containing protein [Gammaproteobacteria bacterium]